MGDPHGFPFFGQRESVVADSGVFGWLVGGSCRPCHGPLWGALTHKLNCSITYDLYDAVNVNELEVEVDHIGRDHVQAIGVDIFCLP
jgi:hypothetical protein